MWVSVSCCCRLCGSLVSGCCRLCGSLCQVAVGYVGFCQVVVGYVVIWYQVVVCYVGPCVRLL